jgi:hypothetical protein
MSDQSYYVYALKDPRLSPAKPFYIGKGTGIRAWDHLGIEDQTRKGKRIAEVVAAGADVVVSILADGLSEIQALKLEAELISAFGTEDSGGQLTNSVIPSGVTIKAPKSVVVPTGIREKAQLGLRFLKEATLELAQANKPDITNSEMAKALGLQSDYLGGSKDYLSWSILGLLMREGRMRRETNSKRHTSQVK